MAFQGCQTIVHTQDGRQFTGIFSGSTLEAGEDSYLLKMVKTVRSPSSSNLTGEEDAEEGFIGEGEDYAMIFRMKNVIELAVANVSFETAATKAHNGKSDLTPAGAPGFRTDADISGNLAVRERNLQRWDPGADADLGLSLGSGGAVGWDQFEANERLYGLQSDYNEEHYTTKINRDDPSYARKAALAEKLAREIEGSAATNAHVAEERGVVWAGDKAYDEEEK